MLYHTDKLDFHVVMSTEYQRCHNGELPEAFKPKMHAYYKERVIQVVDDLPKFEDLPESFGGSGKMLNSDGTPVET